MTTKTIEIDNKEVTFKASAAVPRIYRMKFGRDIFIDLQKIAKSVKKNGKNQTEDTEENDTAPEEEQESNIPIDDLSMFEQIAYVMAKHGDPKNVPSDIMEWLEQFDTFSIYKVLPAILELWKLNEQTQIEAKKNQRKVAVK